MTLEWKLSAESERCTWQGVLGLECTVQTGGQICPVKIDSNYTDLSLIVLVSEECFTLKNYFPILSVATTTKVTIIFPDWPIHYFPQQCSQCSERNQCIHTCLRAVWDVC